MVTTPATIAKPAEQVAIIATSGTSGLLNTLAINLITNNLQPMAKLITTRSQLRPITLSSQPVTPTMDQVAFKASTLHSTTQMADKCPLTLGTKQRWTRSSRTLAMESIRS